VEEVEDLYEANRYIDARFVFVQTKAGRGFSVKEMRFLSNGYCRRDIATCTEISSRRM
jgi:hypothetical protein